MSCKPETEKQRLERIAVALMAAALQGNGLRYPPKTAALMAIGDARELIKQLDAMVLDE